MMGVVCDANQQPLNYDSNKDDFTIRGGIVISKNKKVFDCAKDRLLRETGQDLSYFHEKTIGELAARRL